MSHAAQAVRALALRCNGRELVSAGDDGRLVAWDVAGDGGLGRAVASLQVGPCPRSRTACTGPPDSTLWGLRLEAVPWGAATLAVCLVAQLNPSHAHYRFLPYAFPPHTQFEDPAEMQPASFRALDFHSPPPASPGGASQLAAPGQPSQQATPAPAPLVLVGTQCDLWEIPGAALPPSASSQVGRVLI